MDYLEMINAIEIDGLTPQENRAYRAIEKWCVRLNRWEYDKACKAKRSGHRNKTFSPNAVSLMLIKARKEMLAHERTADSLIALLHRVDVRTELNMCMDAGF